jgi:predicted RNase H-like nuclease (RuvC/YqgF family)
MKQALDKLREVGQAADEIERLTEDRLCRCADEVRCELKAEIERLRGEIIKLQFQGGTVDRQALENNVQRGKKIASLQADNELLSKLNQEYGAEIKRLRAVLEQIANLRPGYRFPDARDIAIEALKHE